MCSHVHHVARQNTLALASNIKSTDKCRVCVHSEEISPRWSPSTGDHFLRVGQGGRLLRPITVMTREETADVGVFHTVSTLQYQQTSHIHIHLIMAGSWRNTITFAAAAHLSLHVQLSYKLISYFLGSESLDDIHCVSQTHGPVRLRERRSTVANAHPCAPCFLSSKPGI